MDDEIKNKDKRQINIELTEEIASGAYSNFVVITHSNSEFILDFIQIMPGTPKAKVRSRVIMTPFHAKKFLNALSKNIQNFEEQFGEINEEGGQEHIVPLNFGGPNTEA